MQHKIAKKTNWILKTLIYLFGKESCQYEIIIFIFPNSTIHDTDVLVRNILIILEKRCIPKINLMIVQN